MTLQTPKPAFSDAAAKPNRRKRPPPFSLRLSDAEKQALEAKAGKKPIGRYIKDVIFSDIVVPGQLRTRRSHYDDAAIAQLTARLGKSRISSNLNQLAKLANMGNLPVDDDVTADLNEACVHVAEMRAALLKALRQRT